MKKIESISIFGEYKQSENRVTAAFLQICKEGGESLIRYLTNRVQILIPSSEIDIYSQVEGQETKPDGLLASNFSFKLFIESKITKNSINQKQLLGHLKEISEKSSSDFLLYLTPDDEKPQILGDTNWASWQYISEIFEDFLKKPEIESKELLDFLIKNFNTLLDNLSLRNHVWDLNNENVIILAGASAESIALKYNHYICQNRRSFKNSRYVCFYTNGQISYLFEILKAPEDNINLVSLDSLKEYLKINEPNYDSIDLRKVFCLRKIKDLEAIKNDTIDKNGKSCPYTYGQPRYTTLKKIEASSTTSQL